MLTKDEFIKYLNQIKDANQCEDDIFKASLPWTRKGVLFEYTTVGTSYLASAVIELINKVMGLPDTEEVISYYCWDMEFGEKWGEYTWEDRSLPEDHKYRKPVIKTLEELYDYCVFLSEEYRKEGK